ncbi:Uncharacterised protein [Escherichia coli]|nr:Uncharacterised protein [Escherichia coli]
MFQTRGVVVDSVLQRLLAFATRQQQRVGKGFAVNMQLAALAQGENQIHRAAQNRRENKRPLWEGRRLAHKRTPADAPVAAALRGDGDAVTDNRHPFAVIQLLFQQDGGFRADICYRHQVNTCLRSHLLHYLFKALGVFAKHQRVNGFVALNFCQRPAHFHIAKMRGQQQFAARIADVKRRFCAWRKQHIVPQL